jgi:hypothetical protein
VGQGADGQHPSRMAATVRMTASACQAGIVPISRMGSASFFLPEPTVAVEQDLDPLGVRRGLQHERAQIGFKLPKSPASGFVALNGPKTCARFHKWRDL